MRQRLAMAFLGLGLLCLPGTASAQSFSVYIGSPFGYSDAYYDDDYYRNYGPGFRTGFYGPRVYGYAYRRAPVYYSRSIRWVYHTRPVRRAYAYGPRVYGYVYRRAPVTTNVYYRRPVGRSGCGTYRFWNGHRCVDARYR